MTGYGRFCAVARGHEVLGDRWPLLIVRELFCGRHRSNDIRRESQLHFTSPAEAKMAIVSYIEGWYNPACRHSSIGYLSPIAYKANMADNAETT